MLTNFDELFGGVKYVISNKGLYFGVDYADPGIFKGLFTSAGYGQLYELCRKLKKLLTNSYEIFDGRIVSIATTIRFLC